jgi:hypothetical protein
LDLVDCKYIADAIDKIENSLVDSSANVPEIKKVLTGLEQRADNITNGVKIAASTDPSKATGYIKSMLLHGGVTSLEVRAIGSAVPVLQEVIELVKEFQDTNRKG